MGPADGISRPAGNTWLSVKVSAVKPPGVVGSVEFTTDAQETGEIRCRVPGRRESSGKYEIEREEIRQRKSETPIVAKNPGNAGGAKGCQAGDNG